VTSVQIESNRQSIAAGQPRGDLYFDWGRRLP